MERITAEVSEKFKKDGFKVKSMLDKKDIDQYEKDLEKLKPFENAKREMNKNKKRKKGIMSKYVQVRERIKRELPLEL